MIKSNLHPINNPVAYVGRSRMVVNSYDGMIGQFLICNGFCNGFSNGWGAPSARNVSVLK